MDLHNPIDWAVKCREAMAERDRAKDLLHRVNYTLVAHGQIHSGTPLHRLIQKDLGE